MSRYRVIRVTSTSFAGAANVSEETLWAGADVAELSEQYPPSDIMGADPLGYSSLEDGCIIMRTRYEKMVGGSWQECEDPRVRLEPELSELEQAIDVENRRLFPGDFLDEPEDNEDDVDFEDADAYDDDHSNKCPNCGHIDGDAPPNAPQTSLPCYDCEQKAKAHA